MNPLLRAQHASPVVVTSAGDAEHILRSTTTGPLFKGVLSISDPPGWRYAKRPPEPVLRLERPELRSVVCLDFQDKSDEEFGGPERADVEQILAWGRRFHDAFNNPAHPDKVLIHCFAGISRSTAAAYVCFAQALGAGNEHLAVQLLQKSCLEITIYESGINPNDLLVKHADDILGRGGALLRALNMRVP